MAPAQRLPQHHGTVPGARPYGLGGNVDPEAVVTAQRIHGRGVPYVSDTPWEPAYEDREACIAHNKKGQSCKAKAVPGLKYCESHEQQQRLKG